ncbi:hypothetical protein E4U34_006775 [Claviceps purpurea]|nr:hypothetical protein E4U34_006775 [Claviceps purpurea]
MKSDTEAELDGASAVDVKADVKPAEDTGCEVRESFEVEVEASLQGMLVVDPTEASGNLSFKLVWYAVLDERELELAGGGKDVAGMLSCVLGEFELIAAAVLEAEFAVDAEAAVEASGVLLTRDRNLSFKLVGYAVLEERELKLAGDGIDAAGMLSCVLAKFELIAAAVLETGFAVDAEVAAEDATDDAAEVAAEAGGMLACVLSASPKLVGPVELMSAVAVEKVAVVDAEAAVEASGVLLTRDRNLSFKLVGYAVLEERELELAEDAADTAEATGMLDHELDKLELIAAAVLEAGFAVEAEDDAEVSAEVAVEAGGMLACVLSASPKLVCPAEPMSAVAVEKVAVVDAEAAVEASGVLLTRDRNLCFKKLVGCAVLDEIELELARDGIDAAGMLSCVLGKFELIAAAVLEAGFAIDAEDAAEDEAEVAVEAAGILACVLSASPKVVGPVELMSAIAVEKVSVVDAEAAVEASGVLTRVGNLSLKLVGYAVLEERELELAEDVIDAAGLLSCVLGKFELIVDAAVLEAGFAVEAEDAAKDAAEDATEVAVEAAGILACVLSASPKLVGPVEIMSAIAVEKVSVVDAEASVEASGVLTRVGNLSFKLVGYAMLEEGELEPAEDAADVADTADAAGMLDCELGKLELLAAAGLEAGFAVDTEDAAEGAAEGAAEDAAEDAAEVAPEATDILAGVLSASLELEDSIKLTGAVSVETVSVFDAEAAVEASGVLLT